MEAISEILVADTDLESVAQASEVEDEFEEKEEEQQQQQQQASSEDKTQAAKKWRITNLGTTSRNTNMHPFVSPAKGVKRSEAPHINKDSSPLSVLMLFFTEICHLMVEQTNVYYQQHLSTDKLDLAADCLILRCRT